MTEPAKPQGSSGPGLEESAKYVTREELEAMLIAQEHRPYSLVSNVVVTRQYPKTDPRRRNATTALAWSILFGRGTVTLGLSVTSIVGLWLTCNTLSELQRQNGLVQEQLGESRKQFELAKTQEFNYRRAENMRIVLATEPCEGRPGRCPGFHPTLRHEALEALVSQDPVISLRSVDLIAMDLEQLNLANADLNGAHLAFARLRGSTIPWTVGDDLGEHTFMGAVWNESTIWETKPVPQFVEYRGGRFGSAGQLMTPDGFREFAILSAGTSGMSETNSIPGYEDARLAIDLRPTIAAAFDCIESAIPPNAYTFNIMLEPRESEMPLREVRFNTTNGDEFLIPEIPLDVCNGGKFEELDEAALYLVSGVIGPSSP